MSVKHVWVICGGVSAEHEVSIRSARNVVVGLQEVGFTAHVVIINKAGAWFYLDQIETFLDHSQDSVSLVQMARPLSVVFGVKSVWRLISEPGLALPCDVVIPMVHGQQGEDGVLQGVLRACDLPFVGADVLSSAICMSKRVTKELLQQSNIATAPWITVYDLEQAPTYASVCQELGEEIFIKPVGQGSSVGISRVVDAASYHQALTDAFCFDSEVLIERAIQGREMECSVLGNREPRVALPGEVVCQSDFYSYAAKYIDLDTANVVVPADLTENQIERIQQVAIHVYRVLSCQGLARVDLFLQQNGEIVVNEVNTIPGFTNISLYAKNWQASGLDYTDLLVELINYAMQVHQQRQQIQTDYSKPLLDVECD